MKNMLKGLTGLILLAGLTAIHTAGAADLPDLEGKEIVVVTENAYPPLQFVDPKTGDAIGWEYDAMNMLAEQLNFKLTIQNASWDAMIPAVHAFRNVYVGSRG